MLWVILGIIFMVAAIVLISVEAEELGGLGAFLIIISLCIVAMPLITGLCVYPELKGKQVKVISLKSEIETMRSAHYPTKISKKAILNGSLDNFKQSSMLSEYIRDYAEAKSKFNEQLTSAQVKRSMVIIRIFGNSAFIDDRVMDMEIAK